MCIGPLVPPLFENLVIAMIIRAKAVTMEAAICNYMAIDDASINKLSYTLHDNYMQFKAIVIGS